GGEAPVPMFVPAAPGVAVADRFGAIVDPLAVRRVPVLRYLDSNGMAPSAVREHVERFPADGTHRKAGTLAHRLFADPSYVPDSPYVVSGFSRTFDRAVAFAKRLREHPDVATLLASGRALYEVP